MDCRACGSTDQMILPDPHPALISEGSFELFDGRVHLPPLGFVWLVERPS